MRLEYLKVILNSLLLWTVLNPTLPSNLWLPLQVHGRSSPSRVQFSKQVSIINQVKVVLTALILSTNLFYLCSGMCHLSKAYSSADILMRHLTADSPTWPTHCPLSFSLMVGYEGTY